MSTINLTQQNFDKTIQENDCVVVDFWANWCGPCRAFSPIFEEVSKKHPDVVFAKVNIDEELELASDFNIRSIPSLMIFRREFAVFAEAGATSANSLHQLIEDAKKVDLAVLRKQIESKN